MGFLLWSLVLLAIQIHSLFLRCARGWSDELGSGQRFGNDVDPPATSSRRLSLGLCKLRYVFEDQSILIIAVLCMTPVSLFVGERVARESFGASWGRVGALVGILLNAVLVLCTCGMRVILGKRHH